MKLVLQWILAAVAALIVGPVAGWLVALNGGVDGSPHATMLTGTSTAMGVLGHLGALALAAGMGVVSARLTTGRYGLFAAGVVLAWAAARSGQVEAILAVRTETGVLTSLAVEGLVLAAAAGVLAHVICRDREDEIPAQREPIVSSETGLAAAAALVAGGVGAWIASQDDTKGQTIAAAAVAGMAGATLARVLAHRGLAAGVMLGVCLLAAAGPMLGARAGAGALLEGMYSGQVRGSLAAMARVAPLDWLAGAFIGVPIGMTWAASMVEKKQAEAAAGTPGVRKA